MWLHLWHLQCIINCSYPVGKPLFREAPGPMIISVKQTAAIRRGKREGSFAARPLSVRHDFPFYGTGCGIQLTS